MNRQSFLQTMLALPAGLFLVHCSSDGDPGLPSTPAAAGATSGSAGAAGADPPGAAPAKTGTQTVFTSSNASSHSHTFTVEDAAFDDPSAAPIDGDTGEAGMHTHRVTVSSEQLSKIRNGESISITTSSVGSHVHVFTFFKVA